MGDLGTASSVDPSSDPGPFSSGSPSVAAEAWAALDAEVAATRAAGQHAGGDHAASGRTARTAEREASRQLSMTCPADVAAALTAALRAVGAEVPPGGPGLVAPALLARVRGLAQLANVVDTALAHAVRAAENAQAAEFDGHKTMRAWLPGHLNVSPATAGRIVRAGRTLEQLPAWDAAASTGRITPDQTATVAKVATPGRLAAAADMGVGVADLDAELTACATGPTPGALGPVVERALDWIDPDGPEPDPTRRRELHLNRDTGTFHGRLDEVGFEKLATAVTAYQQAGRSKDDERSHAQQVGDALVQLTDNALAAATTPVLRGNRAHIAVTIDAEDLLDTDTVTAAARLGSGQTVANDVARHIACDSVITRVLFGANGMPLDVGRTQRLVPAHIRRAAEARDGGCVFAGCPNPTWWCDAHHVAEWIADHGETSIDNTALLCERHHTRVHHGCSVRWDPDEHRWRTHRADGTRGPPVAHRDEPDIATSASATTAPGPSGRHGPPTAMPEARPMTRELQFVRYRSAVPNRRGTYPGIFALANGLAADGRLEAADHAWWAATNAVGQELCTDPSRVDPTCYDRELHPGAAAWSRSSATALLDLSAAYLELLDRYGVPWHELRTDRPGHVVHEDDVQVVAVPFRHPVDWPFT